MDGCSPVGIPEFAYAKANTCLVMKTSSRAFRDKYTQAENPARYCQMLTMVDISKGQMMACPGGVLLKTDTGVVAGAVGVSGAAGDEDEYIAWSAARIVNGYQVLPENHSCTTVRD